jgi:signal recognition particle subunit SRP54
MEPSTRTPEGEPNRCPVCGKPLQIEPSRPPGDAPCPHCGYLLWFGLKQQDSYEEEAVEQDTGVLRQVESAANRGDHDELATQVTSLRQGEFTLLDFKMQLGQMGKHGPIQKIISMMPGMGEISQMRGNQNPEEDIRRLIGIIDSMTPDERCNPSKTVDQTRRYRIATGAGVEPHQVDDLVRQFDRMADMLKKISNMSMLDRMRLIQNSSQRPNAASGRRLTSEERRRIKRKRDEEDNI